VQKLFLKIKRVFFRVITDVLPRFLMNHSVYLSNAE